MLANPGSSSSSAAGCCAAVADARSHLKPLLHLLDKTHHIHHILNIESSNFDATMQRISTMHDSTLVFVLVQVTGHISLVQLQQLFKQARRCMRLVVMQTQSLLRLLQTQRQMFEGRVYLPPSIINRSEEMVRPEVYSTALPVGALVHSFQRHFLLKPHLLSPRQPAAAQDWGSVGGAAAAAAAAEIEPGLVDVQQARLALAAAANWQQHLQLWLQQQLPGKAEDAAGQLLLFLISNQQVMLRRLLNKISAVGGTSLQVFDVGETGDLSKLSALLCAIRHAASMRNKKASNRGAAASAASAGQGDEGHNTTSSAVETHPQRQVWCDISREASAASLHSRSSIPQAPAVGNEDSASCLRATVATSQSEQQATEGLALLLFNVQHLQHSKVQQLVQQCMLLRIKLLMVLPELDLGLVSIRVPAVTAAAAACYVKAKVLKVQISTASAVEVLADEALSPGAASVLSKPGQLLQHAHAYGAVGDHESIVLWLRALRLIFGDAELPLSSSLIQAVAAAAQPGGSVAAVSQLLPLGVNSHAGDRQQLAGALIQGIAAGLKYAGAGCSSAPESGSIGLASFAGMVGALAGQYVASIPEGEDVSFHQLCTHSVLCRFLPQVHRVEAWLRMLAHRVLEVQQQQQWQRGHHSADSWDTCEANSASSTPVDSDHDDGAGYPVPEAAALASSGIVISALHSALQQGMHFLLSNFTCSSNIHDSSLRLQLQEQRLQDSSSGSVGTLPLPAYVGTGPEDPSTPKAQLYERSALLGLDLDWNAFSVSWDQMVHVSFSSVLALLQAAPDRLRLLLSMPAHHTVHLSLPPAGPLQLIGNAPGASSIASALLADLCCLLQCMLGADGVLQHAAVQSANIPDSVQSELQCRLAAIKWLLLLSVDLLASSNGSSTATDAPAALASMAAAVQPTAADVQLLMDSNITLTPRGDVTTFAKVTEKVVALDSPLDVLLLQHSVREHLLAVGLPSSQQRCGAVLAALLFSAEHRERLQGGSCALMDCPLLPALLQWSSDVSAASEAEAQSRAAEKLSSADVLPLASRLSPAAYAVVISHASSPAYQVPALLHTLLKAALAAAEKHAEAFLAEMLSAVQATKPDLLLTVLDHLVAAQTAGHIDSSLRPAHHKSGPGGIWPAVYDALLHQDVQQVIGMVEADASSDQGKALSLALNSSDALLQLYIRYAQEDVSCQDVGTAVQLHSSMLTPGACSAILRLLAQHDALHASMTNHGRGGSSSKSRGLPQDQQRACASVGPADLAPDAATSDAPTACATSAAAAAAETNSPAGHGREHQQQHEAAEQQQQSAALPKLVDSSGLNILRWYCWAQWPQEVLVPMPASQEVPAFKAVIKHSKVNFAANCQQQRLGLSVVAQFLMMPHTVPVPVLSALNSIFDEGASCAGSNSRSSSAGGITEELLLVAQEANETFPPYSVLWHYRPLLGEYEVLKKQLLSSCKGSITAWTASELTDAVKTLPQLCEGLSLSTFKHNAALLRNLTAAHKRLAAGASTQAVHVGLCIWAWFAAAGISPLQDLPACMATTSDKDALEAELSHLQSIVKSEQASRGSQARNCVFGPLPTYVDVRWVDESVADVLLFKLSEESAAFTSQLLNMVRN